MVSKFTPHTHTCTRCYTTWRHDPKDIRDNRRTSAHTCPSCGMHEYYIDLPSRIPAFMNDGTRCVRVGDGINVKLPKPSLIGRIGEWLHIV